MDAPYLHRLPADVRALVADIEGTAAVAIAIEVNQRWPHSSCTVTEHEARIFIPAVDHFLDSSVLHELLHVRRILVDRVPQLSYGDDELPSPEDEDLLNAIDNNLEHLVIVPEELERRPQGQVRWGRKMCDALDRLEANGVAPGGRNALALLCFVFAQHVLRDEALIGRARAIIDSAGLSEHAARLFDDVAPSNQSKEKTTCLFFQLLRLPMQGICFEYLDSRNRTRRLVPLVEANAD